MTDNEAVLCLIQHKQMLLAELADTTCPDKRETIIKTLKPLMTEQES